MFEVLIKEEGKKMGKLDIFDDFFAGHSLFTILFWRVGKCVYSFTKRNRSDLFWAIVKAVFFCGGGVLDFLGSRIPRWITGSFF